jgi:hypothetical protein
MLECAGACGLRSCGMAEFGVLGLWAGYQGFSFGVFGCGLANCFLIVD